MDEFPRNHGQPIMLVRWFALDPLPGARPNSWSSVCPSCGRGTLACMRHWETFQLMEYDQCLLCGQQVHYDDIEDMRRMDHSYSHPHGD